MPDGAEAPVALTSGDIRRRASRAALVIGARGIAIRLLGFVGLTILARYLQPRDFGVIAVGLSLAGSIGLFTDAGIAAGLVRSRDEPARADLQAVIAFQLAVTLPLAIGANLAAIPLGPDAQVVALMLCGIPLMAFRSPATIALERRLEFGFLARVEVLETLAFTLTSSIAVIAGAGPTGVAAAVIVRHVVGAGLVVGAGPTGLIAPRWSWQRLRPLLRFGATYQAIGVIALGRDQGLNAGVIAVAGAATLGIWSIAYRLMQIPFLFFEALWRVSYPAVARLLEAHEDARGMLHRAILQMILPCGALLVTLSGSAAALIPLLFGDAFGSAAEAVPFAALGLLINGPISVCGSGYLFATGRARVVATAIAANSVVWILVALPAVALLGVAGIGVGALAGAAVEAFVVGRLTVQSGQAFARSALPGVVLALPSGAAGWIVASDLGPSIVGAITGGGVALAAYLSLMLLLQRKQSMSSLRFVLGTVRDRGRAENEIGSPGK